jgi:hypothetical protein
MDVKPNVKIDMLWPAAWQVRKAAEHAARHPPVPATNPSFPADTVPVKARAGMRIFDSFILGCI